MNVITRAIGEIDGNAKVNFDLSTHTVNIAGAASVAELRAAIENAGYTVSDTKQDFNTIDNKKARSAGLFPYGHAVRFLR